MVIEEDLCAATLEWAARKIEDPDFLDMGGTGAKKKRTREDAELRMATRIALKKELAALLRAFKNRDDLAPRAILREILEAPAGRMALLVRDAWPLAWKGLVDIRVSMEITQRSIPQRADYIITLTDKGRALLSAEPTP